LKKILHIITRLDRGGSPEDTLYTCINLRKQGYECVIVHGISKLPPESLMREASGVGVKFILAPELGRTINPVKDLLAFIGIFSILRREKPDIVHTHTSKAGIIGRWAAWLYNLNPKSQLPNPKKAKIIHSTHGHVFYGYYNRFISLLFILAERLTANITDTITVLTENEITETLSYKVGYPDLFTVIHSGIEYRTSSAKANIRQKLGISPDAIVIGSAGRFDPVKGYVDLVTAAKIILSIKDSEKIVFLLTGDGIQMPVIKKMISGPMAGNFILTGWQNNVEDYIQAYDIYVQPSINEGLGKTILMAQMLGRPVVATKVQGIVSLIDDNRTGLLANPHNPKDLAEKITMLINDKGKRDKLGENAKNWVFEKDPETSFYKFSVEQMNALYMKLYSRLL